MTGLRSTFQKKGSRVRSNGARVFLVAAYVVLAGLPLGLALLASPRTGQSFLYELGKGAALVGFALLALQVALGARFKFVDRPFGLDVVMQFHKGMAILAGVLVLAHPVLLAIGSGSAWLFSANTGWRINMGKLALAFLLFIILAAMLWRFTRLDYRFWRFAHKGVILVIVAGFAHSLLVGSDIQSGEMKTYWWLLLIVSLGLFSYRNWVFPWLGRRRFTVTAVEPETHNTWTITLAPTDGEIFAYHPGQFMFLKLHREGFRSEEHPFTISSSPTRQGSITVTIKESGDFTRTIGNTRPGDTASIEAPFGRFSLVHGTAERFLFIAGGVGITPIMSMLRYLRAMQDTRPAALIYANRTESDIIFRTELDELPKHVNVVHVLAAPGPEWKGDRGLVTQELLTSHVGDALLDAEVFLCGPPPMMKAVARTLMLMGTPGMHIHHERFAL